MKVRRKTEHVKRGISLVKTCHKGLRLHTACKGTKLLKTDLDDFLKPKCQR